MIDRNRIKLYIEINIISMSGIPIRILVGNSRESSPLFPLFVGINSLCDCESSSESDSGSGTGSLSQPNQWAHQINYNTDEHSAIRGVGRQK